MDVDREDLVTALLEIERFVGQSGWDQPARLFALVPTVELIEAEPTLADQIVNKFGLSSIEQDGFLAGQDLDAALAQIQFSDAVLGVALAVERVVLPAGIDLDDAELERIDPAQHPSREDVRLVVGATRAGERYGLARLRHHLAELVQADNLVPGLSEALAETLV